MRIRYGYQVMVEGERFYFTADGIRDAMRRLQRPSLWSTIIRINDEVERLKRKRGKGRGLAALGLGLTRPSQPAPTSG